MLFQTYGDRRNPAVLFFHAMGVTGASSEPIARYLQDRYFCILPTSTVYCEGQKYVSKADEVRQVEEYLKSQGIFSSRSPAGKSSLRTAMTSGKSRL